MAEPLKGRSKPRATIRLKATERVERQSTKAGVLRESVKHLCSGHKGECMNAATPTVTRPHMPGYGIPEHTRGLLSWEHVIQRLAAARHYWVDTADRAGHVHATPIWGALVDEVLYVEGVPGTRRGRNIAENPSVVVQLESGEDVVIVEGT